ncbi:HAD family phosphatase [Kribbella sandramycini]|uniref:Cof subfamily protein (Haloacid dehalogenase superfamily) n=1 Tax=Kribbella sandramycini TaxID=60450 RepID=A0A7Y4L0F0_9ACTN|nr:HAD family hydrolase [Kribbella sandramycini]MBB6565745.1 Cof subfamily protein (haloacid dehalogenase superfamily) [Kribbella sandramycini]NOL42007.1 HAD family phosphatase [Kribbella sandramycini]
MSERPQATPFRPTAVALDIDGTLIDHDEGLSPAVVDAVRRAAAQVPVILATGRAWSTTKPVAERFGLPAGGLVVVSNGARTLQYPDGDVLDERTFDPRTVIASVREHAPNARMAVEEHDGTYLVTAPFPDGDLGRHATIRVVSDAELAPEPVTRLIIRDPEQSEADFVVLAERLGLHGVGYFVGWTAWLDIAPEGVDKSTGLKVALAQYGLDASGLLAIGDGRNDIEMLRYAGHGVAMGAAPDEVKSAADEVTKSVSDDGVAAVLNRWF